MQYCAPVQRAFVGTHSNELIELDCSGPDIREVARHNTCHAGAIRRLELFYSGPGQQHVYLCSAANDASVCVWQVQLLQPGNDSATQHAGGSVLSLCDKWTTPTAEGKLTSVIFCSSISTVVCGGDRGMLVAFDLAAGRAVHVWPAHRDAVTAFAWLDAERLLFSSSLDGAVRVWDMSAFAVVGGGE